MRPCPGCSIPRERPILEYVRLLHGNRRCDPQERGKAVGAWNERGYARNAKGSSRLRPGRFQTVLQSDRHGKLILCVWSASPTAFGETRMGGAQKSPGKHEPSLSGRSIPHGAQGLKAKINSHRMLLTDSLCRAAEQSQQSRNGLRQLLLKFKSQQGDEVKKSSTSNTGFGMRSDQIGGSLSSVITVRGITQTLIHTLHVFMETMWESTVGLATSTRARSLVRTAYEALRSTLHWHCIGTALAGAAKH